MELPHRLIIDGLEQCASDDLAEFVRMAYQYLDDIETPEGVILLTLKKYCQHHIKQLEVENETQ